MFLSPFRVADQHSADASELQHENAVVAQEEVVGSPENRPRWMVATSARWAVVLGILWLLFGLGWIPDLGTRAGSFRWIWVALGLVLSLSYFASALWLRRHDKADRSAGSGKAP